MPDYKIVYAIIERGARRHWLRVGLAFPNRDGSLNVRLDAMPLSGQLQIRDQSLPMQVSPEDSAPSPIHAPVPQEKRTLRGKRGA